MLLIGTARQEHHAADACVLNESDASLLCETAGPDSRRGRLHVRPGNFRHDKSKETAKEAMANRR